jgi:putative ATPase
MTNVNGTLDLELTISDDIEQKLDFAPLAAQLRPKVLNDYVGQEHILADGMPLKRAIQAGKCHSLILWGPPGTGKTTLAEIIACHANAIIERVSAVTSGIKDIRQAINNAKQRVQQNQQRTLLFVDEVHRFNKSQQDAFLPHIEDGTILFIGATTENPAFELNQAILSRARVYTLKKLTTENLQQLLVQAKQYLIAHKGLQIQLDDEAQQQLIHIADGDARRLLNVLENCLDLASAEETENGTFRICSEQVIQVAGDKIALYDKNGDSFYDLISAFHKSVRGSDPNAALYWYARILIGGGDALYVARRLLAIASEDVGNADPRAMQLAINAWDTFQRVGPSEGERAIAQATIYIALAPKSNAVYQAFNNALDLAKQTSSLDVPVHLKNSTSDLTKDLGHGEDYRYAHNEVNAFAAGENYFPEALAQSCFYQPSDRGLEKQLKDKLNYLQQLNQQSSLKRYD